MHGVHAGGGVGHGGGDAHDDGGAQGARNLAERVAYRSAVVHEAVVQGVHAPSADGHVYQRQREQAHGVEHADPRDRRGVAQQCKAERRDGEHAGADEAEHARAALVEETACNKAHECHDDGAGQQHQARGGCRDATQGLQVDGHEDAGGHEGALHHHADDGGDEELAVGEHTHLEHGLFHLELAVEEHDEGHDAHDDADQGCRAHAGAADDRQAVEQAAKAQRGGDDAEHVERGVPARALAVLKHHGREGEDDDAQACDDEEKVVPGGVVDDESGGRGSQCRREADDEAVQAHGGAALLNGEHEHELGHHEGHHDALTRRLHKAAGKDGGKVGAPAGDGRASREDRHGNEEQVAHREAVDEKCRDWDHDGVHERKAGGEPLGRGGVDVRLNHDGGKRRGHQRLVEHGDERAENHHHEHERLFACESE